MTSPLAQTSDVEEIWRPLTEAEGLQVTSLIVKASAKLRFAARALNIDARIATFEVTPSDPSALDPVIVADVVANIVLRALRNPDNAVSRTQTVGIMSESITFTGVSQQVEARLEVRDSDLAQLRPAAALATIGSIRLRPALAPHHGYLCR